MDAVKVGFIVFLTKMCFAGKFDVQISFNFAHAYFLGE